MIRELDTVVLTHDVQEHGLVNGDLGAVVHCYPDGKSYQVEFVTAKGRTVAVFTLTNEDIRLMRPHEILNARELQVA